MYLLYFNNPLRWPTDEQMFIFIILKIKLCQKINLNAGE